VLAPTVSVIARGRGKVCPAERRYALSSRRFSTVSVIAGRRGRDAGEESSEKVQAIGSELPICVTVMTKSCVGGSYFFLVRSNTLFC
jgi:hypothetical protein